MAKYVYVVEREKDGYRDVLETFSSYKKAKECIEKKVNEIIASDSSLTTEIYEDIDNAVRAVTVAYDSEEMDDLIDLELLTFWARRMALK